MRRNAGRRAVPGFAPPLCLRPRSMPMEPANRLASHLSSHPLALANIRWLRLFELGEEFRRERIARAAPAFRVPHQNAAFDECQNVAQRCVLGTLGKLRVFRGRELARETIEKTVE